MARLLNMASAVVFLVFFVVPVAGVTSYQLFFATDRYESKAITVISEQKSGVGSFDFSLSCIAPRVHQCIPHRIRDASAVQLFLSCPSRIRYSQLSSHCKIVPASTFPYHCGCDCHFQDDELSTCLLILQGAFLQTIERSSWSPSETKLKSEKLKHLSLACSSTTTTTKTNKLTPQGSSISDFV